MNSVEEKTGLTGLMLASKSGYLDLVRLLLNEGADINVQDKDQVSAFGHALTSEKGDNIGLIELLIERGAETQKGKFDWKIEDPQDDKEDRKSKRPMIRSEKGKKSFYNGNGESSSYFAMHKKKKSYGKIFKSFRGDNKLGEKVLPKKSRLGFENDVIAIAICRAFEEIAIKIMEKHLCWEKVDSTTGNSYLHLAVYFKAWKVAQFLLEKGISPNSKTLGNKDVWTCCQDENSETMFKSLVNDYLVQPNFKKKKPKRVKRKRKKAKNKPFLKEETSTEAIDSMEPLQMEMSIKSISGQTASSKGGFLLSQLSKDRDSGANKLLNGISGKSSSGAVGSRQDRSLWDDLKLDPQPEYNLKRSVEISPEEKTKMQKEKKALKIECSKLELKLQKLRAKNDLSGKEKMRGSISTKIGKGRSDLAKGGDPTDSLIVPNLPQQQGDMAKPSIEEGNWGCKLLDFISNQSNTSGPIENGWKRGKEIRTELKLETEVQCCEDCLSVFGKVQEEPPRNRIEAQLGKEMLKFENEVQLIKSLIKGHYQQIQEEVQSLIKQTYTGNFSLKVFGSTANGLNLPGSDLDLLLIFHNDKDLKSKEEVSRSAEKRLHKLSENLNNFSQDPAPRKYTLNQYPEISQTEFQFKILGETVLDDLSEQAMLSKTYFEESKFLRHAQFPVLKMKTTKKYGNFPVDITVKDSRHQGMECVKLVTDFLTKYAPLKPLVLILKQLLNCSDLSDPYTGGLSSYGLILMIVAYLQLLEWTQYMKSQEKNFSNTILKDSKRNQEDDKKRLKTGTRSGYAPANAQGHFNTKNGLKYLKKRKEARSNSQINNGVDDCLEDIPNIFSIENSNLGKLLLGVLYFYAFEFNFYRQIIRVFTIDEEPRCPFIEVILTRNFR